MRNEQLLPGLQTAIAICRRVDDDGQSDGLLRDPADCITAILVAIRDIEEGERWNLPTKESMS